MLMYVDVVTVIISDILIVNFYEFALFHIVKPPLLLVYTTVPNLRRPLENIIQPTVRFTGGKLV